MRQRRSASFATVFTCLAALAACGGTEPAPAATPTDLPAPPALASAPAAPPPATASAPASAAPATPPAPAPPRAIAGDLPKDLDAPLAASPGPCSSVAESCKLATLYPPGTLAHPDAPAAVWSQDFTVAAASESLPKDSDVDYYGVVLRGSVILEESPGKKGPALAAWTAFRIPGGGAFLVANEAGARVALAVTTGGAPLSEAAARLAGKDGAKLRWTKRPAPVSTVDLLTSNDLAWAGGAMHARLGFDAAEGRASLGVLIASEDAPVAQHQHDTSWEVLAALRADGAVRRASGPGATELSPSAVTDGTVTAIPKATQHAWTPGGTKPLVAIQLYVPPGPEQRFKALAAQAKKP